MDGLELRTPFSGEVKAERGITSGYFVPAERYVVDISALLFSDYHAVQPGKDTPFAVTVDALPPNANIKTLTATLHVADADSTDKESAAVSITKNNNAKDPASGAFQVAVDQPKRPRNVQLKLDGGDTIWTFGGVLTADTYDLPDFTQQLNAYLDKTQAAAKSADPLTKLSFVCKSDTSGKVGIEIKHLEYSQVKTQAWPNPLDHTTRVDRNLTLAFGAVAQLPPLDALTDQANRTVQLLSLKLDVSGQFGPDRLLGDVATHDGHQLATISSDYSVAQSFTLASQLIKGPRRCTGITCYFTADAKAELYVELQPDANGYPAADAPLAKANLSFAPPDKADDPQPWTFAKFATPIELKTDLVYWVVVKAARGLARLGLQQASSADGKPQPVARDKLYVNRGGSIWKSLFGFDPIPPVVALVGVVYLPGNDDQTAAVELVVTGAPAAGPPLQRTVDPGKQPQTIALNPNSSDWNTSVLEVRSHAQGTLTIANVIREYKLA